MYAYGLSKSRLMDALQCPKLLWVRVHQPERIVFGAGTERIFAMGHQVGAVAQTLHPGGVLIGGAERFPDLAGRLQAVIARIVDLLPIVKRNYYHPAMRGSRCRALRRPAYAGVVTTPRTRFPRLRHAETAPQSGDQALPDVNL